MTKDTKRSGQLKVAVFMHGDSNYHLGGWRHPQAYSDTGMSFRRWKDLAQLMERGKLDMLFIADGISVPTAESPEKLSRNSNVDKMDPFSVLAALSTVTEKIGLVATCATTYNQPYLVARSLASIDYMSNGRAGWNLVTGGTREDAFNVSLDTHVPHDERYAMAEEFVDVCLGLWDSFEDDAFKRDKASGQYFLPDKLHALNHKGKYFSVKGPLSVARSPQGRPIIVQAGNSEPAKQLSSRVADIVFTAQSSLASAQTFYEDVKSRMSAFGRPRENLLVMPGLAPIVAKTTSEAEEKAEQLRSYVDPNVAMSLLSERLGDMVDLSKYPLDGPFPELSANSMRASIPGALTELARRENLTLGQVAVRFASARRHLAVTGTPSQVADELEHWYTSYGADGFNLLPQIVPGSIEDFVDLVIPELQKRGLFRKDYSGRNLRENLGLPKPQNRYAKAQ
jgi:FMN-dependent oxidoreductase (nitrilotriacetate monooxygenase family)